MIAVALLTAIGVTIFSIGLVALTSAVVMRRDRVRLTTDWQDEPHGEVLSPEEVVRRWV